MVGIGASAGGLEPLESLCAQLQPGRLSYVVLQHLAPTNVSLLRDLLARRTALKVVTAEDGARPQTDTIYVTPPATEIVLAGGALRLSALEASSNPRNTIDTLFRSLATELGPDSLAVVLSGSGTDGAQGLRAIRAKGGVTFAQDPGTAEQQGMPTSALETGVVDYCLAPAQIGEQLVRLATDPQALPYRPPSLDEASMRQIFELLRKSSGVDFATYKPATLQRRIERRMGVHKLDRIKEYLALLEQDRGELDALYGDLLIGVTSFFRDPEAFEGLKALVFPRLLDGRNVRLPIRAWVAGCATGEEAYSLGMVLLEYLEQFKGRPYKVQIFATDLEEESLIRARLGIYPQAIAQAVSPERLQRFFVHVDRGFQICRQLRDLVVFANHNLGKDPPYSRLDLISCRNVLIYMQPPLQKKVLRTFHYSLNPEGFLLLGTSESVGDADHFSLIDRKLKIWARKNVQGRPVFDFSLPPVPLNAGADRLELREHRPLVTAQQLADRKVVELYGPPGVLVDENLEVVQFRGQTGPYFAPTPGAATLNLLKLIRPELLVALRSTIERVTRDDLAFHSDPVELPGEHGPLWVVLEVVPLHDQSRGGKSLLVLFRQTSSEQASRPPPAPPTVETRVQELERELLTTKEYLQTSIADLAAVNEELQSSNEELHSSNEELQSSNEELETSKEELQSTNEELTTVNEELQSRMKQLSVAGDDLQNVLVNASCAVVLVDKDNTLRRFSAAAAKLLHLFPADAGRPVGSLNLTVKLPIDGIVSSVIETNRHRELRFQSYDTSWYTLRVLPYVTAEGAIRGAILDFSRAKLARPFDQPIEVHELVGKVLSSLPHVLVLLDEQLRVVWVNKAFFDTFLVGAEIVGQPLDQVWAARDSHAELFSMLEESAATGKPFNGLVVEHPFGRQAAQKMKFAAHSIPGEGDRPTLTLMVMEEL